MSIPSLIDITLDRLQLPALERFHSFSVSGDVYLYLPQGRVRVKSIKFFPMKNFVYIHGKLSRRFLMTDIICESPSVREMLLSGDISNQENVAIFLWCAYESSCREDLKTHFYEYLLEISDGEICRIPYVRNKRQELKKSLQERSQRKVIPINDDFFIDNPVVHEHDDYNRQSGKELSVADRVALWEKDGYW